MGSANEGPDNIIAKFSGAIQGEKHEDHAPYFTRITEVILGPIREYIDRSIFFPTVIVEHSQLRWTDACGCESCWE